MSTPFDRAIYNADQANLAIAILGGATAHSYQEMGLRGTWALDNPMANYAPAPLIAGMSSAPAQPTRQASSALNLDAHSGKPASEVSMPGLDWPLS
ncbi:MAG TPA: hypothetical protein VFV39_08460, partial [Limnobacter sp.]|nr:hypothetical protein [Limnobacter sp.]